MTNNTAHYEQEHLNEHQRSLVHINSEGSLFERLKNKVDMSECAPPPSDDDLFAEEMRLQEEAFMNFFGDAFHSIEEAQSVIEEIGEQAVQATNSLVMKDAEDLKETTIEQIIERQKKTEGEEFQRAQAQERSGVTVTDTTKAGNGYAEPVETWRERQQSSSSGYNSGYGKPSSTTSTSSTSRSQASAPRKEGEIPKAIDDFPRMNDSVQRMAMQRSTRWSQPAPKEAGDEYIHYAKWHLKFKHKCRKFFKSGKGRITTKVAALILLQLGMGVVGKRYQFENAGQMAMMFTMMVGSFFLTRELAEDGFDPTGFAF